MITKKNINNIFFIFLFLHLTIWTLAPVITNTNLPLDTIEALAWASSPDWGYNKHPPFSAFVVGVVYFIFGANDWAYYFVSQVFVLVAFLYIWKLSKEFFKGDILPVLSVMILESIVFFNYTTPEFNVYVCSLPFKALTVYFFWKSFKSNKLSDWLLTGFYSAIGLLTHYSFLILIFGLFIFFIISKKNIFIIRNFTLSFLLFFLICLPHLVWLFDNNFITITYALGRTGVEFKNWIDHLYNPIIFLLKQFGMILFFVLIFLSIYSFNKKKVKIWKTDQKKLFLICICILPFVIVFFVSLIFGAKIRTMWMSSFYLFNGLLVFYYFQKKINFQKIKNFFLILVFLFFLSPTAYTYISLSNDFKRTDYPGKEIARLVQNKWDDNFSNEIKIVIGDEWSAGNLSYHLSSRPVWIIDLKNNFEIIDEEQGVIYTGNPKILKEICPGVFGTIKPVGYCMIGKR